MATIWSPWRSLPRVYRDPPRAFATIRAVFKPKGASMRKFIAICVFLISALPLAAQGTEQALKLPRVAQNMVNTATVGLTDITVDYSRPSVKGLVIWGGLVPYDQVWRTAPNEATQIS